MAASLSDVRCLCGKLLGRVDGKYEIKCQRCKSIVAGNTKNKENITNE